MTCYTRTLNDEEVVTAVDVKCDITGILQDQGYCHDLLSSLMGDLPESADAVDSILSLISKSSFQVAHELKDGCICQKPQSPDSVIKIKFFTKYEKFTNYLESLRFHYYLKKCGNEVLREHTLNIYHTWAFRQADNYYAATEFEYAEKTLADMIGREDYDEAIRIDDHFVTIMSYLKELHSLEGIRNFWSDIKPENFFITAGKLKIGDLEDSVGTGIYVIPEFLKLNKNNKMVVQKQIDPRIKKLNDVFAFKMLASELYYNVRYQEILVFLKNMLNAKQVYNNREIEEKVIKFLKKDLKEVTDEEINKLLLQRREDLEKYAELKERLRRYL